MNKLKIMNIPFHKPIFPQNISALLNDSMMTGWVTTGPKVKEFEGKLCNYSGAKYAIALNSCTAALHLALAAKGIGIGDKFIVPTFTFVASVEVGEYLGASPILVDSDPVTFNLNIDDVEEKINRDTKKRIKAIIPVHFAGQSVDINRIRRIANSHNIFVLEDAAHALETFSENTKIGDTQHAAAFSFYANKNITTGGEGGALVTNDKLLAEKVRKLSLHGMSKDGWKRFEASGSWAYDVSELGYKYNMTDISASFGIEQLSHINNWHHRRLEIVSKYNHELSKIDGIITPTHVLGKVHAWHLFVIRIIPEMWKISRDELIQKINNRGIGTSVHYKPVHMHSYYKKKYGYKSGDFPNAQLLSETVITLPLYPAMTNTQINHINQAICSLWSENKC